MLIAKAMCISKCDILGKKKKGLKMKKSREVMGVKCHGRSVEGYGRSVRGSGRSKGIMGGRIDTY